MPIIISDDDKRRAHGIDERIFADNLKSGIEVFANLLFDIVAPSSRRYDAFVVRYPGETSKDFKHSMDHLGHSGCKH